MKDNLPHDAYERSVNLARRFCIAVNTGLLLLVFGRIVPAVEIPENLASRAVVSASSEYSGDYSAKFAVDGNVPGAGSRQDVRQAWCCNGAKSGGQADFVLEWDQPVDVAEIVYWGRTAQLMSECWKDYEVYFDQEALPAAKGRFSMLHGPQRIAAAKQATRKVRLKFLSGYDGGQNHGASEIAVYSSRPSDAQLDLFPLVGRELEEQIRKAEEEQVHLRRAASTLRGKVAFLSGSRPHNAVDWTAPVMQPPTDYDAGSRPRLRTVRDKPTVATRKRTRPARPRWASSCTCWIPLSRSLLPGSLWTPATAGSGAR